VFPFSSSLAFDSLVVLEFGDILIRMFLLVLERVSGWFESTLTEFIFTWAFKSFVVNNFIWISFLDVYRFVFVSYFVFLKHIAILNDNMSSYSNILIIHIKFLLQINFLIFCQLGFLVTLSTLSCYLYAINQISLLTHCLTRQRIIIGWHRCNIRWHNLLNIQGLFLCRHITIFLLVSNHILQLLLIYIIYSFRMLD